jgi:hypothetical protein
LIPCNACDFPWSRYF